MAQKSSTETCFALALSGGANNGAWEAGIIWGLMHYGNPADFKWQVVSGISAGAINTAAISGWAVGDEYNFSEWLSMKWQTLTTENVWVYWPEGPAEALMTEQGLFNDAPLT